MDPLTHSLVGAAAARTALGRTTRLSGAALVLGANLPDLDVLAFVGGPDAAVGFRRGWSHGPLALLALPLLLTAVLVAWDRLSRRRRPHLEPARPAALLGLSAVGCLTHTPLDWLNTYGVRLLMPFDRQWFYGDSVFIVDPWLWLALGGGVFLGSPRGPRVLGWCVLAVAASALVLVAGDRLPVAARLLWFAGLAALALARARTDPARMAPRWAVAALTVAVVYVGAMVASTAVASDWVRDELERQGIGEVGRLMVGPEPADPLRRDVLAETPHGYVHGAFSFWPRPTLRLAAEPIATPEPSPAVRAALAAPHVQGAVAWMRFPFAEVERHAEGYTVYLLDARYVRSRGRGFGSVVVELDPGLEVRPAGESVRLRPAVPHR